jgi:hypothetical protein
MAVRPGVHEAHAVAVDGAEQHHEARELEERLALRLRARWIEVLTTQEVAA